MSYDTGRMSRNPLPVLARQPNPLPNFAKHRRHNLRGEGSPTPLLPTTRAKIGALFNPDSCNHSVSSRIDNGDEYAVVHGTTRFGSASCGDTFYEAVVHLGRLLRSVFQCDCFLNGTSRYCMLLHGKREDP